MKKRLLNTIKYILFLGVGALIFLYVYPPSNLKGTIDNLAQANYLPLIAVAACALSAHLSRAMRWKLLIEPLGYKVKLSNSFAAVMIGYLLNTVVPRMGEVSRCISLNRTDKVPVSNLFGTVVVERIIDMIALLLFVGVTILIEFDRIGGFILESIGDKAGSVFSIRLLIIAVAGVIALLLFMRFSSKFPLLRKFKDLFTQFLNGLSSIRKMEKPGLFIAHTLYIWGMYYIMCYLTFFTVDATASLDMIAGLSTFTLSTIGFIVPVPNGVGAYHYMFQLGLSYYGVPSDPARAVAFIAHTGNTLLNVIVGIISLLYISIKAPKKKNEPVAANQE